ncbi:MAG: helicase associated domain-containing protein [Anaerolineae bacterium]|nr:helicase associated domain-containing protein [Anaerolineae bacterium]GIK44923.1 MAG: hypothetical protein BroJett012_08260 [Betaproteobacteria bacterium]
MGTGFDAKTLTEPGDRDRNRRIDRENRDWLRTFERFADEWTSGALGDNIPWKHELYGWVENQRKRHKGGQMPGWKQELLNAISFPWKGGRNYDDITKERIEELCAFFVRYGHYRVTQRAPGCRRLYLWLERLRANPRGKVLDRIRSRIPHFRMECLDWIPEYSDLVNAPETILLPGPWYAGEETSPLMAGWYQISEIGGPLVEMRWYGVDGQWHPSSTADAILPVPDYWRGCHSALDIPMGMLDQLRKPNVSGEREALGQESECLK